MLNWKDGNVIQHSLGLACVSFVGNGIIQLTVETQKVDLEEKWGSFYTA